jgi:uncharacterized membrane protein
VTGFYLAISLVFVLLIVVHLLLPAFVRPTLPFGVRVPEAHTHDPAIAAARRTYRAAVLLLSAAVALLTGAATVATGQRGFVTAGVLILTVAYWAAYYRAHRHLQAVKEREGWFVGLRQGIVVDTGLLAEPARLPWAWAIPPLAILVLTLALGIRAYPGLPPVLVVRSGLHAAPDRFAAKSVWSAFSTVFAQAGLTALLLGVGGLLPRLRQELDAAHPGRSSRQVRVYRRALFKGLAFLSAGVNLSLLLTSLVLWGIAPDRGGALTAAAVVTALAGVVGLVVMAFRVGQGGYRVPVAGTTEPPAVGLVNRDDDRHWIGGWIYVNRQDPALLVNKRFGIGWTLNFAHPLAWLIVLAVIAFAVLRRR